MHERSSIKKAAALLGLACAGAFAAAQGPAPTGVLHLESHIGAFKLFNANGTVKFKFKGTVLIREFQGTPVVTGNVRKEYDSHSRVAYFGDGEFSFTGHFNSLQWFGTDMVGEWDGNGGFRVYGDYDKNLNTGWYWYGSDESKKTAWPTQSGTMLLPVPVYRSNTPHLRKKGS